MRTGTDYEGYIRYADDSIISLQCHENRCGECPDNTPEGTETDGGGPLEGYYCEHSCNHAAKPDPDDITCGQADEPEDECAICVPGQCPGPDCPGWRGEST
jgi:hypothetical protein